MDDSLSAWFDEPLSRSELMCRLAAAGVAVGSAGAIAEAFGAAPAAGATLAAPKRGGTLTVGVGQVIEDINPITAGLYRWLQLIALTVYEPLVKYNNAGQVVPVLAQSVQVSKDFKSTIFTLRRGVQFHNGQPLTADDVVNAIQTYNNPKKSAGGLGADVYAGVEKLDEYRVRLRTKKPYQADKYIRWWFIFPKNAVNKLSKTAVGTGPFKMKSYTHGSGISVVRNENYWQKNRPYLDGINFRFLSDAAAQIANLRSGDVNYLHDIPVNLIKQVTSKKAKLINSGIFFHWWDIQLFTPPLNDVRVRRALLYAFDKQKMNQIAWAGRGTPTWNPFIQTPYAIKRTLTTKYDPERAKSMLEAAGASDIEVPINVLRGSVQGPLEANVIQQGFEAAGVKASVKILDTATWQKEAYVDRSHKGLIENYGTLPFPFSLVGNYMFSPFTMPKNGKPSTVPRTYNALQAAKAAVSEQKVHATLVQLQNAFLDEVSVYHSFMSSNYQVAPAKLYGLEVTKIGDVRFNDAYLG